MTIRDRVLCALHCATERMTTRELAQDVQADLRDVQKALRGLEDEGLAERARDPRDRRMILWAGGLPEYKVHYQGEPLQGWPWPDEES